MDDIMLMLFNLLKILVVVTIAVIIFTYLFNLIVGKRRQTKEEKSLADRKEASKKREAEEKLKTKSEKSSTSELALSRSAEKVEGLDGSTRTSSHTKANSSDFAQRITLTESERSKKKTIILLTKPEEIAGTKYDEKRVRSKMKKVSPRMGIVYIKKNYFSKPTALKVFK